MSDDDGVAVVIVDNSVSYAAHVLGQTNDGLFAANSNRL